MAAPEYSTCNVLRVQDVTIKLIRRDGVTMWTSVFTCLLVVGISSLCFIVDAASEHDSDITDLLRDIADHVTDDHDRRYFRSTAYDTIGGTPLSLQEKRGFGDKRGL